LLLIADLIASWLERGRLKAAAAIQEEFDTTIFDIPWNGLLAPRPDPEDVAAAAARLRGDRAALRQWHQRRTPSHTNSKCSRASDQT
jgi:hypothetical protein